MGYRVIAIDVDAATLETAHQSGADHIFNSRTDKNYLDTLLEVTNGGCDAAAVFAAAKPAYDGAPATLRIGGNLVCVGIPPVDIQLSAFDITMMKYHVFAANNSATPKQLRECAEFTTKHRISSPSRFFGLEQINEMIEIMKEEKMGGARLVVKFDEGIMGSRL